MTRIIVNGQTIEINADGSISIEPYAADVDSVQPPKKSEYVDPADQGKWYDPYSEDTHHYISSVNGLTIKDSAHRAYGRVLDLMDAKGFPYNLCNYRNLYRVIEDIIADGLGRQEVYKLVGGTLSAWSNGKYGGVPLDYVLEGIRNGRIADFPTA